MKSSTFGAVFAVAFFTIAGAFVATGAWFEPSDTPPGGNVSAPINVGSLLQQKSGSLILNPGNNPGNPTTALGILNGTNVDMSGLIRIVSGGGVLIDDGAPGEVLTINSVGTGMDWASPPAGGNRAWVSVPASNVGAGNCSMLTCPAGWTSYGCFTAPLIGGFVQEVRSCYRNF